MPLSLKVGPKGGISIYGLGRFPVTLYKSQWDTLFENAAAIRDFIAEKYEAGELAETREGAPEGATPIGS